MVSRVGAKTTVYRKSGKHVQRRFAEHKKFGSPLVLSRLHPAVVEGRSLFPRPANTNRSTGTLLKTGMYQRKLGKVVTKGRWKGFPIFALTLEERATCPRSCLQWNSCYGNRMQWAVRAKHGVGLMSQLVDELAALQKKHPRGFVVRLHILGDFFSVDYVSFWAECLKTFPALNVFGYTARTEEDEIGRALRHLIAFNWDRFAIRSSGGKLVGVPASVVVDASTPRIHDAVPCPAQHDDDRMCANCAFCWHSKRAVSFIEH